ncbi:MAG: flagellar hook-associated protein FlgK [Ignavibacteriae bacterium]|nr:MAG: flagellar hook-associated protein FlgK [Ignavibacteriota bacterium]
MAVNRLFGIASSSLFAHQQALTVTSTNLANVNNPAYSRQVSIFGTTNPDYRSRFSFGSGVAVEQVNRVRNSIVDSNIRSNNHKFYQSEKKQTELSHLESLLSEDGTGLGLSNLFQSFFNSWEKLAANPESSALRTEVVQSAQSVSSKFGSIHEGIRQKKVDLRTDAMEMVGFINTTLKQLQTVNEEIYKSSVVNHNVNDLLDSRDKLLEDLSEYVDFNVSFDKHNVASVSIGGIFAVDGTNRTEFEVNMNNEQLSLTTQNGDVNANIYGGKLNAVFELHNQDIPAQLEQLDELANVFMANINKIHKKGFTITEPTETQIEFFTHYDTGVLEINEKILKDNRYLAVSGDGNAGDSSIALELAKIKDSKILNNKTIGENYSDFVTDLGNDIQFQKSQQETLDIVLTQLNNEKMETSAVSTNEEMMNVLKYQRSYDAAAKLITVADELLQTILTMV